MSFTQRRLWKVSLSNFPHYRVLSWRINGYQRRCNGFCLRIAAVCNVEWPRSLQYIRNRLQSRTGETWESLASRRSFWTHTRVPRFSASMSLTMFVVWRGFSVARFHCSFWVSTPNSVQLPDADFSVSLFWIGASRCWNSLFEWKALEPILQICVSLPLANSQKLAKLQFLSDSVQWRFHKGSWSKHTRF